MSYYILLGIAFAVGFVHMEIWHRKNRPTTFTRVVVTHRDGRQTEHLMENGKYPWFDRALKKHKKEAYLANKELFKKARKERDEINRKIRNECRGNHGQCR